MIVSIAASLVLVPPALATRLHGVVRSENAGWIYVRLEGSPRNIGFQYGYTLAKEIDDANKALRLYLKHKTNEDWWFYRQSAKKVLWPKVPAEYRQEIGGMAEGLRARGYQYDTTDLVAQNGWLELAWYYVPYLQNLKKAKPESKAPEMCSAFVATGSATKDGGIVMAHNSWVDYVVGERWNLMLDIRPTHGHRILMDSWPGFIHSGDDFAINSAGIMITETTIDDFVGFKTDGTPEFVRMRRAIQYGSNLDDVARIFTADNNGGYANMWLLGDSKTGEIGKLELGLKNVIFHRTRDGAYVSSNFPEDPKLTAEECLSDKKAYSDPDSDRLCRWQKLMTDDKGKVDAEMAKVFLGDHHDQVTGKDGPCLSVLCGHGETESRADHAFDKTPFNPAGAVQGKVTTSALTKKMSMWARMGHPCGEPFVAAPFLKEHPEFKWQEPMLRDMPTEPWALFTAR